MSFEITVMERPAKRLAGIATRSSMATARKDCPTLWERLMTSVAALAGMHAYDAYGVSTDFAEDMSFTYWAALDASYELLREPSWVGLGTPVVPLRIEGLATIDVRAGRYAVAAVPDLATLPEAYGHLYEVWPKTQTDYTIDYTAPCFELYPKTWRESEALQLYVPVKGTA